MSTSHWATWGELLGNAYVLYALGLLAGCLGPHLLLLGAYVWSPVHECLPRFRLAMEWLYGLLNPVVYLLVFDPALFRAASPRWLQILCWSLLTQYWALRLLGALSPDSREALRRPIRHLLALCMVLIPAMGVRDFIEFTRGSGMSLVVLSVSPLYLVPLAIAALQRRHTRDPEAWAAFNGYFLSSRVSRVLAVSCALGVLLLATTAFWRPSERATREMLLAHRGTILSAATQAQVDPRLIASIVFVTHREHTTPFRSALEALVANAWLTDAKSHALLAQALDPSLGLAQIKPKTVLTALLILHDSGAPGFFDSKHSRDVILEGQPQHRIASPALVKVQRPLSLSTGRKPEVVQALLDPPRNIELCAFLLNLYATQWETARADWAIRHRPEILATLYQIGLERSHPKPEPQANEFGRSVHQMMDDPWMVEHFGTVTARTSVGSWEMGLPAVDETFDNVWDIYISGGVEMEVEALFSDEEDGEDWSDLVEEVRTVSRRLSSRGDHTPASLTADPPGPGWLPGCTWRRAVSTSLRTRSPSG